MPTEWNIEKNESDNTITVYFGEKNTSLGKKEYAVLEVLEGKFTKPTTYENAAYCLSHHFANYKDCYLDEKYSKTPILIATSKDYPTTTYVCAMMINEHDLLRMTYTFDPELSDTSHYVDLENFFKTAELSYGNLPRS